MLTHTNLAGQAMTNLFTIGADINNDVGFIGVPLFHIAGIGNMITGLLLGLPTVLYPLGAFDPGALLDVLEAEKVTGDLPGARPVAGGVRRAAGQPAGAAAARAVVGRRARVGHPAARHVRDVPRHPDLAAFGQTEMSPVTCMLLGEDAIRKLGSVGKVIPTVAARVVDDDMNDVPVGQVGEIVYRAPTLMAGYWNNPKATAEAFAGGWFHSGDLVRQDDEGYVWVVDRKKDMIISGGENIYCAEVENVLAGHPAIVEVAVIGRADQKWGEVPVAVVALGAVSDRTLDARRSRRIPHRTARPVQASEGTRSRRRAAAQPRWQSPENGTERRGSAQRNSIDAGESSTAANGFCRRHKKVNGGWWVC